MRAPFPYFRAWRPRLRLAAFSLLELLVVMAIVVLLLSLSIPATQKILESYRVGQAMNLVQSRLGEARQIATSLNRSVEVRLCRSTSVAPKNYRVLQTVIVQPDGSLKPAGRATELPVGICVTAEAGWSSLMTLAEQTAGSGDPNLSGFGTQYAYRKIRFFPSGLTDLSPVSKWFVTLFNERYQGKAVLPPDFAVVQLDPVNGLTRAARP